MCEKCSNIGNDVKAFACDEGIVRCLKNKLYYIVIEHFRNEINTCSINHCPWCGRRLECEV